jgi:hypothetical protein
MTHMQLTRRITRSLLHFIVVQTAHDQAYLTKTLLSHLPPVEQRVAEMRSGRGPTGATPLQNQEALAQSQVGPPFANNAHGG